MNKVVLMGRLTRDPEVRYSQGEKATAVARFSLAVQRRFKREGDADADFINCVAWNKTAEFVEKYFTQGRMIIVVGRIQTRTWEGQDGKKNYVTEVIVSEAHFTGDKRDSGMSAPQQPQANSYGGNSGFQNSTPVDNDFITVDDDQLPF